MGFYYHSTTVGFADIAKITTLNIYSVGCIHNCRGCHCPDLQDINHPERRILDNDIDNLLKMSYGLIKGICWFGGDPLYQPQPLFEIIQHIKKNYPDLLQIIFTGYVYNQLNDDIKHQLCQYADYLIDGKYNGHVLGTELCNQKVYKFENQTSINLDYNNFLKEIKQQIK